MAFVANLSQQFMQLVPTHDEVVALLERGADLHARTAQGETALDFAKQRGRTPVVDLLIKAGAEETPA